MTGVSRSFILFILMVIVAFDSKAQSPSANIVFDERVYNFGTIQEKDGKVTHTFVFRNVGKTAVLINDIYSGCGCIGKSHSEKPVAPGQKGKITVTFDPSYKSGFISKEIIVYSNNGKEYNRIWVEGNIIATEHPVEDDYPYNFGNGLYMRLKVLAFGYLNQGETREMELHYVNTTASNITLNFSVKDNKTGLTFINPGKVAAKARGVVYFSYTMPFSFFDDVTYVVYPYINGQKITDSIELKILNTFRLNNKKGQ